MLHTEYLYSILTLVYLDSSTSRASKIHSELASSIREIITIIGNIKADNYTLWGNRYPSTAVQLALVSLFSSYGIAVRRVTI